MELEFQASDFSKLMFPILSMPDNIDPIKHFPKLEKWEEFHNPEEKKPWSIQKKNKIFRYIVLMYDKESPFRVKIDSLTRRKVEVSKYVKLIADAKNVPEDVMEIIQGKNERVNKMVIAYARMHRNSLYSLILGLEKQFYGDLLKIEGNTKSDSNISDTQKKLEEKTIEFLNQDNTPLLQDELFAYIEEQRLSLWRPEGIAESISKGEDPFNGKTFPSVTN